MEYQKIINLLNNKSNQTSKFRTSNLHGTCSACGQIRLKTSMLRSCLLIKVMHICL